MLVPCICSSRQRFGKVSIMTSPMEVSCQHPFSRPFIRLSPRSFSQSLYYKSVAKGIQAAESSWGIVYSWAEILIAPVQSASKTLVFVKQSHNTNCTWICFHQVLVHEELIVQQILFFLESAGWWMVSNRSQLVIPLWWNMERHTEALNLLTSQALLGSIVMLASSLKLVH